jgi:archaellum component FlaC
MGKIRKKEGKIMLDDMIQEYNKINNQIEELYEKLDSMEDGLFDELSKLEFLEMMKKYHSMESSSVKFSLFNRLGIYEKVK